MALAQRTFLYVQGRKIAESDLSARALRMPDKLETAPGKSDKVFSYRGKDNAEGYSQKFKIREDRRNEGSEQQDDG